MNPLTTMAKVCQSVCIQKPENEPETEVITGDDLDKVPDDETLQYTSDKKTDEVIEPVKPASLLWRMGSGLYNTSRSAVTGTVGMGYGGVKWVAGTSYNVTSAVVTGTINGTKAVASKVPVPASVPVPFVKRKDKKE